MAASRAVAAPSRGVMRAMMLVACCRALSSHGGPMKMRQRRLVISCAAPALREGTTAAVLSLNAGGVTQREIDTARSVLGAENTYATRSLEEAKIAANEIVERGYATVVTCGGDGTLAAAIRDIRDARKDIYEEKENPLAGMPRFAPLPLGTGNAVARFACGPSYRRLKSKKGFAEALRVVLNATATDATARELSVPLIKVDSGELCFLAGVGYDAFILDDYSKLQATAPNFLKKRLKSLLGYFVATATRTLPAYLRGNRKMRVRVSATNASYVDPRRGDAVLAVREVGGHYKQHNNQEETTLYVGRATIVAAGSTPFYGGGMRLFPFARNTPLDQMHLRIARMSPWRFVPNVLGIFSGAYRSPAEAFDFVGSSFTVELLDGAEYPFQHSGDADVASKGARRSFRLSIATHLRFVDVLGMPEPIKHLTPR